jgi:hypothetical protein
VPLSDNNTGTPPAVTYEMLDDWRKIADDVNAALTMGGEQGMELLASLMAEWCAAIDDVNTAREICVDMAARGLRSEALEWHADGFFEVAERLSPHSRQGWEEWEAAMLERQMPIPIVEPALRDAAASIAGDLELLDLSGRQMQDWLSDLRRNVIGGGRLGDRLTILESIRGIDPNHAVAGSVWQEMIVPIRRSRAGKIAGELQAAIAAEDFTLMESLRREVDAADWGDDLPDGLRSALQSAANWKSLVGLKRQLADAAAQVIGHAEALRNQTDSSRGFENAVNTATASRDAYVELWETATGMARGAGRVPAIAAKLKEGGVLEAYKSIDTAAREHFAWIEDQELYRQVRDTFREQEGVILQHATQAPLEGGEWDAVKREAAAWKREAVSLESKTRELVSQARIATPGAIQDALKKLEEARRRVDERVNQIVFWERTVLLSVVGFFVLVTLAFIMAIMFSAG